jgi:hypothetical protein
MAQWRSYAEGKKTGGPEGPPVLPTGWSVLLA